MFPAPPCVVQPDRPTFTQDSMVLVQGDREEVNLDVLTVLRDAGEELKAAAA